MAGFAGKPGFNHDTVKLGSTTGAVANRSIRSPSSPRREPRRKSRTPTFARLRAGVVDFIFGRTAPRRPSRIPSPSRRCRRRRHHE